MLRRGFSSRTKKKNLFPNQFLILKSEKDDKKSAICSFINDMKLLYKKFLLIKIYGVYLQKIKNKNLLWIYCLIKIFNIVSLTGQAGTGKTLIAAACGLEQVLNSTKSQGGYDKLIITRPVQPMGRDIGFLPGTLEEKMMPWIAPLRDNLEYLFGDKTALDMHMEQGVIEIEAMTYIQRSIYFQCFYDC